MPPRCYGGRYAPNTVSLALAPPDWSESDLRDWSAATAIAALRAAPEGGVTNKRGERRLAALAGRYAPEGVLLALAPLTCFASSDIQGNIVYLDLKVLPSGLSTVAIASKRNITLLNCPPAATTFGDYPSSDSPYPLILPVAVG